MHLVLPGEVPDGVVEELVVVVVLLAGAEGVPALGVCDLVEVVVVIFLFDRSGGEAVLVWTWMPFLRAFTFPTRSY